VSNVGDILLKGGFQALGLQMNGINCKNLILMGFQSTKTKKSPNVEV